MKLLLNIGLKGFSVNRLAGQELTSLITKMPRTNFDYESEVNGRQSAIIMACVSWAQRTFPEAPIKLDKISKDGEWEKQASHPMLKLLEKPNPYYDGLLLQMAMIADWMLDGNAYFIKIRSNAGRVVELWWAPSTTIEPKYPMDNSQFINHYEYYPGYQTIKFSPDDIIHFRNGMDPNNIRKGLSPLKSLFREVFTDDEAANMTAALLKNLGVPGMLISPDIGSSVATEELATTKTWFKENFTGDKRGEPLVMSGATKVQAFGFSPQQMEMKALRRIPEERVSAVLGIPAIVAGLGAGLDRSTFANYKEAREAAYESNIIPTQKLISSVLKHQLLRDYEDDTDLWRVGYDLSEVRILQEDENALSTRTLAEVTGGVLKVADAQRILDLPVDETQDFYLRQFALIPTPSGAPVSPEPEPTKSIKLKSLNDEQKETYWKQYVLKAENYEKNFITGLKSMFTSQQKEALKNLKRGKTENLISLIDAQKSYKELATPVLSGLIQEAVDDATNLISPKPHKAVKAEGANQYALQWLKTRITWAAEMVGEQTATLLSKALVDGYALGEGMEQIASRVKDVFVFCKDYRALRIARTETIQASAQGTIEGYKEVGVERVKFYAALDERTCPECMGLHEQEFSIEDSQGVITVHPNCRCVWLASLKD